MRANSGSRKIIRANNGPLTSDEGNSLNSNAGIDRELNEFFTIIFTIENNKNIPEPVIK